MIAPFVQRAFQMMVNNDGNHGILLSTVMEWAAVMGLGKTVKTFELYFVCPSELFPNLSFQPYLGKKKKALDRLTERQRAVIKNVIQYALLGDP